jgi:hypothetical protein
VRASLRPPSLRALALGGALAALAVLFWWARVVQLPARPHTGLTSLDVYASHLPMTEYGFSVLREGHVPLWNPFQMCGVPFLAIHSPGLFYPLTLPYLVLGAAVGSEVSFVLHMFLAGAGTWLLVRRLGMGVPAAWCGAVTFMWSGFLVSYTHQPSLFAAVAWLPALVLALERTLQRARLASLGLVITVACQTLVGAPEVLLHAMYAGALFTVLRLGQIARRGGWRGALERGVRILACIGAGTCLAALQLLPSLELAGFSVRAGRLGWRQVVGMGSIAPAAFARGALANDGLLAVGVVPLFGLALGLGLRRQRLIWAFGLGVSILAALLVFGGAAYGLYYQLPWGGLFRRPNKFLDIFALAQALLASLAIERLERWARGREGTLWTQPSWLLGVLVGVAGALWLLSLGQANWWLLTALGLLIAFAGAPGAAARSAIVALLVILQGASLFLGYANVDTRPVRQQPGAFDEHPVLRRLRQLRRDDERAYVSQGFMFAPTLTLKRGSISRLPVTNDYEVLMVERYGAFFDLAARNPKVTPEFRRDVGTFVGAYELGPRSRWALMDLTGTRYFVMARGEPGDVAMAGNPDFRLVDDGPVRIFERPSALPRAYFVARARVLPGPEAVLQALDAPDFEARSEVLLEGARRS